MQNLLANPFQPDTSFVDLRAEGVKPAYLDVMALIGNAKNAVIRATWGSGKTYSLENNSEVANQALLISHRKAVIFGKSKFKDAMCINTFSREGYKLDLKQFSFIIIDEVLGVLDAFAWDMVNFLNARQMLSEFDGGIICLDADATAKTAELMSKLCNKQFELFEHKTGSREKYIGFTRDIKRVRERAASYEAGVRLLIFNTRKEAEEAYEEWGVGSAKKMLINPRNSYKAKQLAIEAHEHGNVWIFATPCIQEGLSIEENLDYVYTAYIHHKSDPNFLRPIDKAMQSIHRVRRASAERTICVCKWNAEQPIEEAAFLAGIRADYAKALKQGNEYLLFLETKGELVEPGAFFVGDGRDIGLEIYAHHRAITNRQNGDFIGECYKALRSAGYEPFLLDGSGKAEEIPFDNTIAEELDYSFLEQLVKALPIRSLRQAMNTEAFVDESLGYTKRIAEARSAIAFHCGIEKANNAVFIQHFYDEGGPNHRLHYLKELRAFDPKSANSGSLFIADALSTKYVYAILQDAMGKEQWADFGTDLSREHIVINKQDVYSHPLFSELAGQCGIDISKKTRHKWFWSLLRKRWLLDFTKFGKGLVKYKLTNDLLIGNERGRQWQVHSTEDSYARMLKDYPNNFASIWYGAKYRDPEEFAILNRIAEQAGFDPVPLLISLGEYEG